MPVQFSQRCVAGLRCEPRRRSSGEADVRVQQSRRRPPGRYAHLSRGAAAPRQTARRGPRDSGGEDSRRGPRRLARVARRRGRRHAHRAQLDARRRVRDVLAQRRDGGGTARLPCSTPRRTSPSSSSATLRPASAASWTISRATLRSVSPVSQQCPSDRPCSSVSPSSVAPRSPCAATDIDAQVDVEGALQESAPFEPGARGVELAVEEASLRSAATQRRRGHARDVAAQARRGNVGAGTSEGARGR